MTPNDIGQLKLAIARLKRADQEATPAPWTKPFEDGALSTEANPRMSLCGLDVEGMARIDKAEDAELIVLVRNDLELLLKAASEVVEVYEDSGHD